MDVDRCAEDGLRGGGQVLCAPWLCNFAGTVQGAEICAADGAIAEEH